MKKTDLDSAVQAVKAETRAALQALYGELPKGQQKKVVKSQEVRQLLDRYGVVYDEGGK